MLTNAFKTLVNNFFKINLRKIKNINILIIFYIFYKNSVKNFFKLIINHWLKITRLFMNNVPRVREINPFN